MNEQYRQDQMWTLPVRGTLGRKAENLYRNTQTILRCGWEVPKSMVIPFEYYQKKGGIYYMLDDITACFPDSEFVAVRSNASNEDDGIRIPGLYLSKKVAIQDRHNAINDISLVLSSYESDFARRKRREKGLPRGHMSLLVQEWIPTAFSGCFSDLGEIGILRFTDPTRETEAMNTPSVRQKLFIDNQGNIKMNIHHITTYDQEWAKSLRNLTNKLPNLNERGWELEFVTVDGGKYILQTTPIKKQPGFEVKETEENIFHSREVIGSGEFRTNGILYLPYGESFDLAKFDRRNKDYCLVVSGGCISKATTNKFNPLHLASNARALLYVSPEGIFSGLGSFAAHAETFIREGERCGLVGMFLNDFRIKMSGKDNDYEPLFLDTKLLIQTDEVEQKANVEMVNS
jgi:hypothetical protein